jgi:hypothetical protein
VPENWVEIDSEEECVLSRDFDATELSLKLGEGVWVEFQESGWAWGQSGDGHWGWIPTRHIRPAVSSDYVGDYALSDADQLRMLRKLMLYWDGQWFLKAVDAHGLNAAIDLNARVRASFGRIEMRTLLKTLKKRQANDLLDAMQLLQTYGQAFMAGTLRAEFQTMSATQAEVRVERCAAYEGAKRAGLARVDQACVACEGLWTAWLEILLPGAKIQVDYPARMGKGDAHCRFLFRVTAE